jgi:hypothetical protein
MYTDAILRHFIPDRSQAGKLLLFVFAKEGFNIGQRGVLYHTNGHSAVPYMTPTIR